MNQISLITLSLNDGILPDTLPFPRIKCAQSRFKSAICSDKRWLFWDDVFVSDASLSVATQHQQQEHSTRGRPDEFDVVWYSPLACDGGAAAFLKQCERASKLTTACWILSGRQQYTAHTQYLLTNHFLLLLQWKCSIYKIQDLYINADVYS